MKLVIAADIYPPDIGGPATYASQLKAALTAAGWSVDVVCYSDQSGADVVRVVRSANRLSRYLRYFFRVYRLAKKADLMYAMGPVSAGLPAMWAAKLAGKPLVVKVVGDYAWEQARNRDLTDLGIDEFQTKKFTGQIGKLQAIERRVCQYANKVIVPSQYLKRIVSGWGIEQNRIVVIYNAQLEGFRPPVKAPRNIIVSVGRLVPWKGFPVLIELMAELVKLHPSLQLKIFGGGPQQTKLEKMVNQLGLANRISIKKVKHNDVILAMANAELFILNSGYEGFSHTVLEAMAVGTPVIASNVCGNPEIVQDHQNGLLVGYNDKEQIKNAILELHEDQVLRERLARAGLETVKKFTFTTMMEQTIKALTI